MEVSAPVCALAAAMIIGDASATPAPPNNIRLFSEIIENSFVENSSARQAKLSWRNRFHGSGGKSPHTIVIREWDETWNNRCG
ncbi:hypothetical protein [Rhizobium sp. SL42]|uniref:hypothetical protein n=1 Tax=Rhizobium sp. SL42 TaxID=2806346 RepID=UPI001F39B751|nr:hypothetical protein [Rhizobium sp. SL42]UJW76921.1 hypothetical protein IM739_05700 [Rhizobium sp. SL42]